MRRHFQTNAHLHREHSPTLQFPGIVDCNGNHISVRNFFEQGLQSASSERFWNTSFAARSFGKNNAASFELLKVFLEFHQFNNRLPWVIPLNQNGSAVVKIV